MCHELFVNSDGFINKLHALKWHTEPFHIVKWNDTESFHILQAALYIHILA